MLLFSASSVVSAQSEGSELSNKEELYQKLGYTQNYVSSLQANPESVSKLANEGIKNQDTIGEINTVVP